MRIISSEAKRLKLMDINKNFSIIVNGVGGQGLMTLLKVISAASIKEGLEVKTSELHGLSQRGGAVEAHLRFGKKVFSPLVPKGEANLIISLETQEALVVSYYASKKAETVFVVNQYRTPTFTETIPDEKVLADLKKISKKVLLVPASNICQKELNNPVVSGIFLLGIAAAKKLISLDFTSLENAMKETVPEKYLELNLKAFNLAKDYKI